jgi:hypothetical protein
MNNKRKRKKKRSWLGTAFVDGIGSLINGLEEESLSFHPSLHVRTKQKEADLRNRQQTFPRHHICQCSDFTLSSL